MHFSVTALRNFTFQCLLYGLNNYIFPIGSSSSFSLAMIQQAVGILFIGHIPDRKMGIQGNMKARLVLAGKYVMMNIDILIFQVLSTIKSCLSFIII